MLFSPALFATQKIEVLAKKIEGNQTVVHATDGVVVYYQDAVLYAQEAHYNKDQQKLLLDGAVEMIGYEGTKEHTEHLELDIKRDYIAFHHLFFSSKNDIWLLSEEGNKSKDTYTFGESILSSCDIENPIWVMQFDKARFDAKQKYMQVYGARVYFKEIPIFYFPYMAFTTQRERTSGLLFPLFGYSEDEGFVYEQPIFWAINPSVDIEFNPQVRTKRSVGLYATLRFADSPYSTGALRLGYFKDKESYLFENQLEEESHYGLELLYDRSRLFTLEGSEYRDGLYANITLLNDIDYLNLQKTTLTHFGQVPLQESRVNYYISNNSWYSGLYEKYFIDTRLADNSSTIQTLPEFQLHKYHTTLWWDFLSYSIDLHTKHLWREEGVTLKKAELQLPIEAHFSFWDDYIDLTLGESLYYGAFFFSQDDSLLYRDFSYSSNVHTINVASDLIKRYNSTVHVIQPSLTYILPGNEHQSPVSFNVLKAVEPQVVELFDVGLPEEKLAFDLNQYWYNQQMTLLFYQRFSQSYYFNRSQRWGTLENEMQYNWNNWTFYNQLAYSHEYHKISESSSRVSYEDKRLNVDVGYSFKRNFGLEELGESAKVFNADISYLLNETLKIDAGFSYDLDLHNSRLWHFGLFYKEDCWSVGMRLDADVLPRPTQEEGSQEYTQEYGFTVQFNFIPFLGIGSGKN